MKIIPRTALIFGLLLTALTLRAQPTPSVMPTDADAAYAAFEALLNEQPLVPPKEMGREGFLTWRDQQYQRITTAGLSFYAAYPTDPRRWNVVSAIALRPPLFARSYGPDVAEKGQSAAIIDYAAKAAWDNAVAKLQQELLDSTDAPAKYREAVEWGRFAKDFSAQSAARRRGEGFNYAPFRARFEVHITKYAELDIVRLRATDYLGALEKNLPGSTEEIWRQLLTTSNEELREAAAAKLRFIDLSRQPLELDFVAVDGRSVSLADLRGKVVLVDFWATWCGPCIAELPNIKKVYADYHARGFEIVGIALENARLAPTDTADQTAVKHAQAKQVLTDFTAKHELSWPHYYDGKFWKNALAVRYGIQSIPAMFLLDREGRLVSTNARGEKLEAEVKRLLGL